MPKYLTDEEVFGVGEKQYIPDNEVYGEAPRQDGPITKGFKQLGQRTGFAKEMTAQDYPAAAENIAQTIEYQRQNPGSESAQRISEDWRKDDAIYGDDTIAGTWQGIKNVTGGIVDDVVNQPTIADKAGAAWENVKALGSAVVEQTPNMIPPMAGMLAGGAAGSTVGPVVGTAVGAFGGATAGNTLVEGQGVALKSLQEAGIDPTDRDAVASHLEENAGRLFGQAATKGAIIGLVDTITAGAASKLLRGPAQAAANRALVELGVDVADRAAVKAATQTPEFAAKIAADATFQASKTGVGNVARNVGAAGLEPVGEFAGEYVGSGVAMDDWNVKDATVEALSSVGQSGVMYAGQKAYQTATKPNESSIHSPSGPSVEERKAALEAVRQANPTDSDLQSIKTTPELQRRFGVTPDDIDLLIAERAREAQVDTDFAGASEAMKAGAKAAVRAQTEKELLDRVSKFSEQAYQDDLLDDIADAAVDLQAGEDTKARARKFDRMRAGQFTKAGTYKPGIIEQEDAEAMRFGRESAGYAQQRNRPVPPESAEERAYRDYSPEPPPDAAFRRGDDLVDDWAADAVDLQQREDRKRMQGQPLALPPGQGFEMLDPDEAAFRRAPQQGFEMVSPEESAKRVEAESKAAVQRGQSKVDIFFNGLLQNIDAAKQEGRTPQNQAEKKLLGMDPLTFRSFEEAESAPTREAARQLASKKIAAIEQANFAGYITDEEAAEFEKEVIAQRKAWVQPKGGGDAGATTGSIDSVPRDGGTGIKPQAFPGVSPTSVAARNLQNKETGGPVVGRGTAGIEKVEMPQDVAGDTRQTAGTGGVASSAPLVAEPFTTPNGKSLIAITGETYSHKDSIKSIPGARWNKTKKAWTVPAENRAEMEKALFWLVKSADVPSAQALAAPVQAEASPAVKESLTAQSTQQASTAGAGEQGTALPASQAKRGTIGEMLGAGETRLTATGRETTPFPKVDTGSSRKATNTIKRVNQWLMDNAIAEAESRGDEFNLLQFQSNRDKPSQADKDSAEMYLFDEEQPAVPRPLFKNLTEPPTRPTDQRTQESPDGVATEAARQNVSKAEGNETKPSSSAAIAARVQIALAKKTPISSAQLFSWANEAYGGTQGQGAYTPKDAYDALELGINLHLANDFKFSSDKPRQQIRELESLMEMVPTQTKRTAEQDQFQQYSTPPTLAFVANWVANLNAADSYLEPSAGIGGLAVFAKIVGVRDIAVNELSGRRRQVLQEMGFDTVYGENAEQLNNVLPDTVRPTVVVMNPPFSATGGRLSTNKTKFGAVHIEQALKRLAPGGRLVAIVGEGMAHDKPTFRAWWKEVEKQYSVRANVGMDGTGYRKYGTTFDNQLLVIDKTGPTTDNVITGKVDSYVGLVPLLREVRNDRRDITSQQDAGQPTGQEVPYQGRVDARPGEAVPAATSSVGVGGGRAQDRTRGGSDDRANAGARSSAVDEGTGRGEPGTSDTERVGLVGTGSPRVIPPDADNVATSRREKTAEVAGDATVSGYHPTVVVDGAKPHPADLVESAAMAAVRLPQITYSPRIPKDKIASGALSEVQLEAIVAAGQAHQDILPSGERRGFFIGDGTGVGKGREIAGIIADNWNHGRKKAIWVSKDRSLAKDAKRDLEGIGMDAGALIEQGNIKAGENIPNRDGVLFTAYSTVSSSAKNGQLSRLDAIVAWAGQDYDGVIAFDESHKMGNAIELKDGRYTKKPSQMALAALDLQKRLPKARVVYVSATGATEISNLAYATRLGLWGEGTAFANAPSFIASVASGGIAAMEVVARDMKATGSYLARKLAYNGKSPAYQVKYRRLEHELSEEQRDIYDELAGAWQVVLANINAALALTDANSNGKSHAMSAFWGAHQRFFNQVLTAMQMPSVIRAIRNDVSDGKAVVLQITNTNEASTNRALANADNLEDLDITPRDQLMQMVQNSFPVQQYEEYEDEDGNKRTRPVVDSQGNPVLNREAVAMREALLDKLGSIRVPDAPLEQILDTFGVDQVAEVTGRSKRIVTVDDGSGPRKVRQSWSKTKGVADAAQFMADKKRILIFSEAGGTGASYHADLTVKNQRQRSHYILQAGWRADSAIQGLGRSHRSNQAVAPIYSLVTTNLQGHRRFISSIARRLSQMGALTEGQRTASSQGLFSERDNLESVYAADAVVRLVTNVHRGVVHGLDMSVLSRELGIPKLVDEHGQLNADQVPSVTKFLNRILSMKIEMQNKVFDLFSAYLDANISAAEEAGTLDTGLETMQATAVRVVGKTTVHTDKKSGAETEYVQLDVDRVADKVPYSDKTSLAVNKQSGKAWQVVGKKNVTNDDGGIREVIVLRNARGATQRVMQVDLSEKFDIVKDAKATRALWKAEVDAIPDTVTTREHLITGALLPIWDKLKGHPKIVRVVSGGESMLGRLIPPDSVQDVMTALDVEGKAVEMSGKEAMTAILDRDQKLKLDNGWSLMRRKVAGEDRLEVSGVDWRGVDILKNMGAFTERISYQTRIFIPTDKAGAAVLDRIFQNNKILVVQGGRGGSSEAMYSPSAGSREKGPAPTRAGIPPLHCLGERNDAQAMKDIAALSEAVNKNRRGRQLDFVAVDVAATVAKRARRIASMFGKRVVFFKGGNPTADPGGVAVRTAGDVIFVNVASGYSELSIIGHETLHHLKAQHPDIYGRLKISILALAKESAVGNYQDRLQRIYEKTGTGRKVDTLLAEEELIADFIGDRFTEQAFWSEMADAEPTLFRRFAEALKAFLEALLAKFRNIPNFETDKLFVDLQSARNAAVDALSEYSRREKAGELFKPVTDAEINAPAFKKWFGESKVKSSDGRPVPVFHGSPNIFYTFEGGRERSNTSSPMAGLGHYFALDAAEASGYSKGTGNVRSFYLRIEKPYATTGPKLGALTTNTASVARLKARLLAEGYDGILIKDEGYLVAFDGRQVKSAEQNTGEFSTENADVRYTAVLQAISSAATSLRQVAAIFKKGLLKPGTVNVDIGGGRFDEGTEYLANLGVENLVYDPFNRAQAYNDQVVRRLSSGGIDTATINNVLNVIKEKDVRSDVVRQAAKAIKPGGTAYFQIHEGDADGKSRVTKVVGGIARSWQNHQKTEWYMDDVATHFGTVTRKGNLIIATDPRKDPAETWEDNEGMPFFSPTAGQAANATIPAKLSDLSPAMQALAAEIEARMAARKVAQRPGKARKVAQRPGKARKVAQRPGKARETVPSTRGQEILAKSMTGAGNLSRAKIVKRFQGYEEMVAELKNERTDVQEKLRLLADYIGKFPREVRVNFSGVPARLSAAKTEKRRLLIIRDTLIKIDAAHEIHIKRKLLDEIEKTISKNMPVVKGNIARQTRGGFDLYAELREIGLAIHISDEKITKRLEELAQKANSEAMTFNEILEMRRLSIFGRLKKQSSVEVYQALLELKRVIAEGVTTWKAEVNALRAKRSTTKNEMIRVITGGRELKSDAERNLDLKRRSGLWQRLKDTARAFDDKHQSFEWILDKLSRLDKSSGLLDSFLIKTFAPLVNRATAAEQSGVAAHYALINEKMKEIWGLEGRALEKKLNQNSAIVENTGVIVRKPNQPPVEMPLSQNMAYKRWMEWQDPTLREQLERQGYTSTTILQIENFMTDEVMEWAQWQLEEFYPQYYGGVNEVFKKLFYTDMPFNPRYSPIRRRYADGKETSNLLKKEKHFSSVVPGAVRNRVDNHRAIELQDGDAALSYHLAQMEHFKAWSEPMRELRALWSSNRVRQAVIDFHGAPALRVVDGFLDDFARGKSAELVDAPIMQKFRANFTTAVIGMNPVVFLKQLTGIPAYAAEIPVDQWARYLPEVLPKWREVAKTLGESEVLKARFGVGFERDMIAAMASRVPGRLSGTKKIADKMMFLTRLGDKGAVMVGGWPVYRYHYEQAIKAGKSVDEAKAIAMEEFEQSTERTQQAGNIKDMGAYQRGGEVARLFTMFMTAPNAYYRQMAGAARELRKSIAIAKEATVPGIDPDTAEAKRKQAAKLRNDAAKRFLVVGIVLPVVFQFVAGAGFDDDDTVREIALGPMNGLFMLRDIGAGVYDYAAGNPIFDSPGTPPPLTTLGELQTAMSKIIKKWRADEWLVDEDFWKIVKSTGTVAGNLTGLPVGPVTRLGQGVYDAATGNTVNPALRALGYSEEKLDRANRDYLDLRKVGLARKESDPVLYRAVTNHDERRTMLRKRLKSLQERGAGRDEISAARMRIQESNMAFVQKWGARV